MKKNKLFEMFSSKPVTKDDEFAQIPTNFKGFFVMLFRKFWNLSSLSILYSVCNFPVFFLLLAYSLKDTVIVVASPMSAALHGFMNVCTSSSLMQLFPIVSAYGTTTVPTTTSYVCLGISLLFLITFGLTNAGAAYIIRGYNRGEPVFLFSDFFSTIKKNWKQSLAMGVIDIVISFVLVFDFMFWYSQPGFVNGILMYFALFLCVIYFFMRFYIYTLLITFDLSIYKILKDAFLMSFLGFKRNFVALFGIILVLALSVQLFILIPSAGIMLPIILTFALLMFISGYASYPVIKKYMIDPYYHDDEVNNDDDEPVFEDRG